MPNLVTTSAIGSVLTVAVLLLPLRLYPGNPRKSSAALVPPLGGPPGRRSGDRRCQSRPMQSCQSRRLLLCRQCRPATRVRGLHSAHACACADSMRENVSALCTSRTQNAVRSHGECPGVWCLCSCMLLFFHMHRPHADLSLILVPAALARAESPAGDQEAAVVTDLL